MNNKFTPRFAFLCIFPLFYSYSIAQDNGQSNENILRTIPRTDHSLIAQQLYSQHKRRDVELSTGREWRVKSPFNISNFCEEGDILIVIPFIYGYTAAWDKTQLVKKLQHDALAWVNPKNNLCRFVAAPWYNSKVPETNILYWNQEKKSKDEQSHEPKLPESQNWSVEDIKKIDECTEVAARQYSREMAKLDSNGLSGVQNIARWVIEAPFEVNKFCKKGDSLVCVSLDFWPQSESRGEDFIKLKHAAIVWVKPDTKELRFVAAPWLYELE